MGHIRPFMFCSFFIISEGVKQCVKAESGILHIILTLSLVCISRMIYTFLTSVHFLINPILPTPPSYCEDPVKSWHCGKWNTIKMLIHIVIMIIIFITSTNPCLSKYLLNGYHFFYSLFLYKFYSYCPFNFGICVTSLRIHNNGINMQGVDIDVYTSVYLYIYVSICLVSQYLLLQCFVLYSVPQIWSFIVIHKPQCKGMQASE
jgi:hypothetical protein